MATVGVKGLMQHCCGVDRVAQIIVVIVHWRRSAIYS